MKSDSATPLLNDYYNLTGYVPIDSDWVGAGVWWHEAYYCAEESLEAQIAEAVEGGGRR